LTGRPHCRIVRSERFGGKSPLVGRTKQHPARHDQRRRQFRQFEIIPLRPERPAFLRRRKRRRIEQHDVPRLPAFREPLQPVEHVAENKIVAGKIEFVRPEVVLPPLQIIARRDPRWSSALPLSPPRRRTRKCTQNNSTRVLAVVCNSRYRFSALIEKETGRQTFAKVDQIRHAVFPGSETALVLGRPVPCVSVS